MDLDIQLTKENVSFSEVQTIVNYILSQGYSIANMQVRAE